MSESSDVRQGGSPSAWKPGMHADTRASGRSLIGPTVVIRGQLSAEEDLLIMGRVEGFIDHSRTITIHPDGVVAAEVKAQEVLVEGRVDGNVYGTSRVQIAQSGKVNGNVYSPRVGVLEGASFKGAIDMEADVSVIERRFREATGSEMPAREEQKAGKPAEAELKAATAKGDSDAAQADEEGFADKATASKATGTKAAGNSGGGDRIGADA